MCVAETRAVNRALRKAYGIGICSIEEIGIIPNTGEKLPPQNTQTNGNGAPKVRDRFCHIIRQHKLDPELVKAYAVDFCGTKTLREASREQVENFVLQLADWAEKDRNALLCQLNSYSHQPDLFTVQERDAGITVIDFVGERNHLCRRLTSRHSPRAWNER
jgi:hypothetical protein